MSKLSDREYLLRDQYRDASNLNTRFQLHERFSTNKYGWHRWVFDRFDFPPEGKIFELGCGPGLLWDKNMDRIPAGWDMTLSDLSPGMIQEARDNLGGRREIHFEVVDAQSIPFEAESFDGVIANHMLYHVPDRSRALSEIHRVLRGGGTFYAATGGKPDGPGFAEWVDRARAGAGEADGATEGRPRQDGRPVDFFSLETGGAELSKWFCDVALYRYEDALEITEADALVDYVQSSCILRLEGDALSEFRRIVEAEIEGRGCVHISKANGVFEAHKQT